MSDFVKASDKQQYPQGTNLLWNVNFMPEDIEGNITAWGSMHGSAIKLDGTFAEAAAEAEKIAKESNMVIQCMWRRY